MITTINGNGYTNGNGHRKLSALEKISIKLTKWIGTPVSLIIHTLLFAGIFALRHFFGVSTDYILLILTTAVSLEAIYLSIFIQMTVNRNTESLEEVEEDIEDIQEDATEEEEAHKVLIHVGAQMKIIQQEIETLKKSDILKPGNGNGHRIQA